MRNVLLIVLTGSKKHYLVPTACHYVITNFGANIHKLQYEAHTSSIL